MSASAKLELVLEAIDRASGPLERIERHMDRLEKASGQSSRAMTTWGQQGAKALREIATAAAVAGAAVALVGKNVISSAADFESSLTGIQTKAGLSEAGIKALGEEIKGLATSGDLAVPISEIASAYERGAAAGLPLDQLKSFATLSAKAADAFEMSAEDVGNAAAGFNTSLKIPMDQMQRYFDLINKAADSGISNERDIIEFLDRTGASLKVFGLANEQMVALGATMLDLKMPADVASRAMSTLTTKLLAPGSKQATKALKGIVGDSGKFQKLLKKDPNAALIEFLDRVRKLDKFKAADLLTGFLGQGFSDEIIRVANGMDTLNKHMKIAADPSQWLGSLDQTYAAKLDDFWSQWQISKNSLEKISINLGTALMPYVKVGLEQLGKLVEDLDIGAKLFPSMIDGPEFNKAKESLGNAFDAVSRLLGINPKESQILKFFTDLADAVNTVATAINAVADAVDRVQKFGVGTLLPHSDGTGPIRQAQEDMAAKIAATRGVPVEQVKEDARAAARRRAEVTGQPYREPFPEVQIVKPLQIEGEKAVATAIELGDKIAKAAGIEAKPIIDISSILGAKGAALALDAALRALPNTKATSASATPTVPIDGARAAGGPVSAGGLYLVGEEGPELLETGSAGKIHTARKTSRLFQNLGSGRGGDGGGGSSGAPVDASIHIGSVNYGDAQGKEDFEKRLRAHQRLVAELVAGEGRRQSRANF